MTSEDEADFCDMLRGRGDTSFVIGRFYPNETPSFTESLPPHGFEQEVHLVNPLITPVPRCTHKTVDGIWLFDLFKDVHIEFQRSFWHSDVLIPGRIFAKIGWCSEVRINKEFQKWYSAIERWLKRTYSPLESTFWIGPNAKRWSESGGVLSFGPIGAANRTMSLYAPCPE